MCESACVLALDVPQLRAVQETRGLLDISFHLVTHKCRLTRKYKFLRALFMWLIPQTRQSSQPHTEMKAFKQEAG